MVLESVKIMASMWMFMRAFARAIIIYINEKKAPRQEQLKGRGLTNDVNLPEKLPTAIDIKRALPKHCFNPKISTSMLYVIKDLVQVAICYAVFASLHAVFPLSYWPTMVFYWAIQGTFFTAIFVLGHDCGHGSFSHNTLLNDIMGNILHSFLLVPYYMWKLSHKHHHKNNANFEKDEVFYPVKQSDPTARGYVIPGFGFGIGWFYYLIQGYKPRNVQHFTIFQPMFSLYKKQCGVSLFADGVMLYLLYKFYQFHGMLNLFNYYLIPLFIFGSYTVIITFLHHNEMNIPWYNSDKWDFIRGQLSTIDRHYGIVHNVIHNIGTHQIHHMFIKIPHYHLEEATEHFRADFPDLVRTCDEPIMPSFLRMFKIYDNQKAMDDSTEIHYYKQLQKQE